MGSEGGKPSPFAPLRHREFGLFFWAATLSNVGSWMQTVAVPYAVFQMTNRNGWLGIAALVGQLPALVANALGGTLADRLDRRRILFTTQTLQMLLAFTLWGLWVSGHARITNMLVVLFLAGTAGGLNTPAWQSFIPQLVPKALMQSALRLNSMQFAVARMLGPVIAGLVLQSGGASVCFFVNAVTYLFVLAALLSVRSRPQLQTRSASALQQLREGWAYMLRHTALLIGPLSVFVIAFFGFSLTQLGPAIVAQQFDVGKDSVGWLLGAYGLGGLAMTATLLVLGDSLRRGALVRYSFALMVIGLAVLGATRLFPVGLVGFGIVGASHVGGAMGLNQSLQLQVAEEFRGRAVAIYLQGLFLGAPLGAAVLSRLSEDIGVRPIGLICSVGVALYLGAALLWLDGFRSLDRTRALPHTRNSG